jgi:hypothetical protein
VKRLAIFVLGALLLTTGCHAAHGAVGALTSPRSAQGTQAGVSEHSAIAAVMRESPEPFKQIPEEPGKKHSCQIGIGGPPGATLKISCELQVAREGHGWVVSLIEDWTFNGSHHQYTTTYLVSANGTIAQPAYSGDSPAILKNIP